MNTKRILKLTAAAAAGSAAALTLGVSGAAAAVAPDASTSENWAGYVAQTQGSNFSSVSGSWVVPTAKCSSDSGYSAFWVGLGGSSDQSGALEQAGTQSDCDASGQTDYYAWYELIPAAPVKVDLAIKPGDHITTKVSVSGSTMTSVITNQTTGQTVTKTIPASQTDTSSAEWIAEAPSQCDQSGNCQPLPLANFDTVDFTNSTATAGGHTGTISDSDWTAQPVQLGSGGSYYGYDPTQVSYDQSGSAGAVPSQLSSDGSSFSVAWQSNGATSTSTGGGSGYGDSGSGYGYGYGGDGGGLSGYVLPY